MDQRKRRRLRTAWHRSPLAARLVAASTSALGAVAAVALLFAPPPDDAGSVAHDLIAMLTLALVLNAVATWHVLRSGLAPLHALEEGAAAMAAGRLDTRLAASGPPELRRLVHAFNRMACALQQGREELRASEERLAFVIEAASEGLWDWDLERDSVAHNARWSSMLSVGDAPSSHPFAFFADRVHPEDRETVMARIRRAIADGSFYESEHRMVRADGGVVWVHARGRAVAWDARGVPRRMSGAMADITARKQVELAHEALTARQMELVEETRRAIAREIHDEMGQRITVLRMDMGLYERTLPTEALRVAFGALKLAVDDLLAFARDIAGRLRPADLELGLAAAVEGMVERFEARTSIRFGVAGTLPPDLPIGEQASTALFRVLQEAVTNAVRHAQPERIEIAFGAAEGMLCLQVADDGSGFDAGRPAPAGSHGLAGMRHRIAALGGRFAADSTPGRGTRVSAWVPLARLDPAHQGTRNPSDGGSA